MCRRLTMQTACLTGESPKDPDIYMPVKLMIRAKQTIALGPATHNWIAFGFFAGPVRSDRRLTHGCDLAQGQVTDPLYV